MTPNVKRAGRDLLVYLVGAAAASQTFARSIEALLDHRRDLVLLYGGWTVVLMALTVTIERVKAFVEE